MEFTKREYQQFYHGISMSLLSKKSAQKWRYDDETAEEIRFLEGLESKVLDKIRQIIVLIILNGQQRVRI